jgi:starch-binding outer membrane protein, SusD/RagB family
MKNLFLALIMISVLLLSCNKTLNQSPQDELDASIAYTTRQGIESGILGTYNALQSSSYYGLRYLIFADMSADNISHVGISPPFAEIYNNQILASNSGVDVMWRQLYDAINRSNTLIEAIPKINDPVFNKPAALAETQFLRALFYFDLLRYFGGSETGYNKPNGKGVPLWLTPTFTVANAQPKPRSTEAEVYSQILLDIDYAIANLPATSLNGRANKTVATALKARIQLYREQWDETETLATTVIAPFTALPNGGLVNGIDYANIYLTKNIKPESIWELVFDTRSYNEIAYYYYPSALGGRSEFSASSSLKSAHEAGDLRLPINYTVGTTTIPAKKTRKYSKINSDDDVMLIRLAELYLIRAEARIRKAAPDLAGAAADINTIRNRAGLSNTTAVTASNLLLAVENERRVELAHEGHRWFDLRRYNKIGSTLGITEPFRALFPIPERDVQVSGGVIVQNPNY